ncbi:MAG: hypothetical protein GFH27_549309n9 [Chloroflexi bacterium AL-W]|nr:hypothetical protein [Chloroflexi bacterium AL-N1]NOK69712.1 hypothetical protein [Chloroflexi bacterium AL-N10]NOK73684.1 hypothetical protein [Chloroflexi bacterium AL-N5]NOK83882.1 hypothetical protein [Chloroflexi bacterium AL-W]NOK88015.1 hypothetical protein [Chloroflexi bacterium AL-N15]
MTLTAFQQGLQQNSEAPLTGMGAAFEQLIDENDEMLVIMQCVATVNDPDIQRVACRRFRELYDFAREHGELDNVEYKHFLVRDFTSCL